LLCKLEPQRIGAGVGGVGLGALVVGLGRQPREFPSLAQQFGLVLVQRC
jgi:hypothetical protein